MNSAVKSFLDLVRAKAEKDFIALNQKNADPKLAEDRNGNGPEVFNGTTKPYDPAANHQGYNFKLATDKYDEANGKGSEGGVEESVDIDAEEKALDEAEDQELKDLLEAVGVRDYSDWRPTALRRAREGKVNNPHFMAKLEKMAKETGKGDDFIKLHHLANQVVSKRKGPEEKPVFESKDHDLAAEKGKEKNKRWERIMTKRDKKSAKAEMSESVIEEGAIVNKLKCNKCGYIQSPTHSLSSSETRCKACGKWSMVGHKTEAASSSDGHDASVYKNKNEQTETQEFDIEDDDLIDALRLGIINESSIELEFEDATVTVDVATATSIVNTFDKLEAEDKESFVQLISENAEQFKSGLNFLTEGKCNQCAAAMINGVFCHEHGCPNAKKKGKK